MAFSCDVFVISVVGSVPNDVEATTTRRSGLAALLFLYPDSERRRGRASPYWGIPSWDPSVLNRIVSNPSGASRSEVEELGRPAFERTAVNLGPQRQHKGGTFFKDKNPLADRCCQGYGSGGRLQSLMR